MNTRRSRWFVSFLLLGLSVVVMELDYVVPMSQTMHQLGLVVGIILLLATGATYIYQRARGVGNEHAWWNDDDWSHWGGI